MLHTTPADCVRSHWCSSAATKLFDWDAHWTNSPPHFWILTKARLVFFGKTNQKTAPPLTSLSVTCYFYVYETPIFGRVGSSQRFPGFIAVSLSVRLERLYLHQALLLGSKGRLFVGVVVNVCWLSTIAAVSKFMTATAGAGVSSLVMSCTQWLSAAATPHEGAIRSKGIRCKVSATLWYGKM